MKISKKAKERLDYIMKKDNEKNERLKKLEPYIINDICINCGGKVIGTFFFNRKICSKCKYDFTEIYYSYSWSYL